jgi:2'-deoxynucleoside 5'-phosphate N-hydrolase
MEKEKKIYFAGSIYGGRDDADLYLQIINYLKNHGEVLTEHVGNDKLAKIVDGGKTSKYIHDRDLEWLLSADYMVAEVTQPSLGVGYEIRAAVEANKKILCLYRPKEEKKLSAMIVGCEEVTNKNYQTLEEAQEIIDRFFSE